MQTINFGYGDSSIEFTFNKSEFEIIGKPESQPPLSDAEIGRKLDQPIDSAPLEDLVSANETVLIVVPDATREVGCGQIVNLLVRRLIANGTMPFEINIIFATGIHRKVTEVEKQKILTPFIAQRVKTLDHDAKDLMQIMRLGETKDGIPIEVNRKLTEYDHTIIIGGINFHYFAGFTGGRKSICPGLASARTIAETHKLAFDFETKTRQEGVNIGKLNGNPVHEAFLEVVEKIPPAFAINTVVNDRGEILDLTCGDWRTSHETMCETYDKKNSLQISEKRDVVIVSCGGFPHDLNMIQAHKSLDMASRACKEGGKIVFLAECKNGLGRNDFLDWFDAGNAEKLADRLCERYQVNGQTAWSLLTKAEMFEIQIITDLPEETAKKMRLKKVESLLEALKGNEGDAGYILPFGAKVKIEKGG